MVDRMIRVCCSLTNLRPSGVPFDGIEHQQTLFNYPCLPIHYSWQILILAENALLGKHDKSLPQTKTCLCHARAWYWENIEASA